MAKKELQMLLAERKILNRIYIVRGHKVMLDSDLAEMYKVETRRLNEQVKRNKNRFPKDFMFTLSEREYNNLMSQIATSSSPSEQAKWGGRRKLPYAFTEQGVAMLSSVLNSDIAIEVNIRIIRVFTKMREFALTNKEVLLQLAKLERDVKKNSQDIEHVFVVIKELLEKQRIPAKPKNRIGFKHYASQE
ncbi:MAG: ORF6N domain-containing protein [Dinghuibacter sp.]|nr:ORF6N domain-containing protein [Dinghuibacter sp.]